MRGPEQALEQVIGQLDGCFNTLKEQAGKIGQALTEIDWLASLRSRVAIPGGTCEFDLPIYHDWRHRSAEERRADLQRWIAGLLPLAMMLCPWSADAAGPYYAHQLKAGHDEHGFYTQHSGSGNEKIRHAQGHIDRAKKRAAETGKPYDGTAPTAFAHFHQALHDNEALQKHLKAHSL